MTHLISAVFETRDDAAQIVRRLKESGFSDREFTVVAGSDAAQEEGELESEQQTGRAGAWAGSALGAAVAGSVGLMSMALIPAVPLMMVGGAAAAGAAADAVTRFGSGPLQDEQTQRILRAGGAVIVVDTDTDNRARIARDVLGAGSRYQVVEA
jgi:hypothetical protein